MLVGVNELWMLRRVANILKRLNCRAYEDQSCPRRVERLKVKHHLNIRVEHGENVLARYMC